MIYISALSRVTHVASRYLQAGLHYTAVQLKGVKGLELRMPALSPTMSEGTIIKWLKKEGDPVTAGDALCEIQTDKAVMTFDTEEEGILAKILLPDDSKDIKIGTLIAMMVDEGEDWKGVEVPTASSHSVAKPTEATTQSTSDVTKQDTSRAAKTILGPATKKLLLDYGLDRSAITPSGPQRVLLKGDVLKYVSGNKLKLVPVTKSSPPSKSTTAKSKPVAQTPTTKLSATGNEQIFVDLTNSERRKTLAADAVKSKTTIPHSYCSVECQVDEILKLCQTLQEENSVKVSSEDFIIKAAALAMRRVPEVNAQRIGDGGVRLLSNIDVSIDVQTDSDPQSITIHDAINLGLTEIAEQTSDLTKKTVDGSLQSHQHSTAPLTVSNLSSYGVTQFTEIVLEHQTAVLAVGTSRLALNDDGSLCSRMTATLSYDARVFNEFTACKFLNEFASILANPSLMLVLTSMRVLN